MTSTNLIMLRNRTTEQSNQFHAGLSKVASPGQALLPLGVVALCGDLFIIGLLIVSNPSAWIPDALLRLMGASL